MEFSALDHQSSKDLLKKNILITDVGSYLGVSLAKSLLLENCTVYGVGNSPLLTDLLIKEDFTLLELDLAQPLPAHLPNFDLIFHLNSLYNDFHQELSTIPHLSPAASNLVSFAKAGKSKVFLLAPISTDEQVYEYLIRDPDSQKFLKLLIAGDIYGPGMSLDFRDSTIGASLSSKRAGTILPILISQAIKTGKVILDNEGLDLVYPAYISDVIFAINRVAFSDDSKNIQFLVSESPKTSLSVAYEIQKVARIILKKELGLFFTGAKPTIGKEPESEIKIHDLGFSPKVELEEGLKTTFEYFSNTGLVKTSAEIESYPDTKNTGRNLSSLLSPQVVQVASQTKDQHSRQIILARFSSLSFRPRLKSSILVILAVLFLFTAKTILDFYLGVTNIKSAQAALYQGDFDKAKFKAQKSSSSFKAASNKIKILLSPFSMVSPQRVESINLALEGASTGSYSTVYFIEGSQQFLTDLQIIASKDSKNENFDLETPAANFKRAYFESSLAQKLFNEAKTQGIFKSKIESIEKTFENFTNLSLSAFELTSVTGDLIGNGDQKTYLILLQNNTEIRPGGGFIGNFGLVQFENGRLKNIDVEDIYTIDGQLKEKIEPPKELTQKLGIDRLYLRDSNWSADFAVNTATARDFYKKETGRDVNGVIAIDLSFIQNLLSKIGPIKLEDYKEEITADNLFQRGEYYSEVGSFPGSTQKRDFFGALSRSLVAKVLDNIAQFDKNQQKSTLPSIALLESIREGLLEKHIMLTFDNPNLSSLAHTKNWDHPLPPMTFNPADDSSQTRDFLAISEANLGANKVNRLLQRNIDYQMTIGRDADLVAKLKIVYTNNSQAETWPAGKYVNFLRVYVPFAADLFGFENGDKKDVKDVEVTTNGNLTTLATFVEVPIKSTREVIFTYRIPKNIKLEKAPFYHLYVQKQPGTDKDSFEFTFNLPDYLTVKSVNGQNDSANKQNLTIRSDLAQDRQFEIELAKK